MQPSGHLRFAFSLLVIGILFGASAWADVTGSILGVVRDSYGKGEEAAHRLVRESAVSLGLEVAEDAARNLFVSELFVILIFAVVSRKHHRLEEFPLKAHG